MNKDIFVAAFEKKLYHYSHKEETLQNISERLEYIKCWKLKSDIL